VDEALAQLFEVLHQAHAGEFGAVGDGFAGAVDGVEISHVKGEELGVGRPVEGGRMLRSPETAMGRVEQVAGLRRGRTLHRTGAC
jgi:hypothetical protein